MPEPFKNLFNPTLIQGMAENLTRVCDQFDSELFLRLALHNLDALELKERSLQITNAIEASFPVPFEKTVEALLKALHPDTDKEITDMRTGQSGIAGWAVMPMADYIANAGAGSVGKSLSALREMTMRSSSEFAVRPFFRDHPEATLKAAANWALDLNRHVRRLASEGCRPRLPWGIRLHDFVDNPEPILPILNQLRDDPSEYVRRSVANNLNDIAKDHPDLVAEIAVDWLHSGDKNRARLVRHACRTLIKGGHPGAMSAYGFKPPKLDHCTVSLAVETVTVGDKLDISLSLTGSGQTQKLLIDYIIHFLRANGSHSPKVFKWTEISLKPGETRQMIKAHPYRKVTTRKDYPGSHRVSVRINGVDFDGPGFELTV